MGIWVLFVAVQTCYILTLLVSPGFVKLDPKDASGMRPAGADTDPSSTGSRESTSMCKKCNIVKPPRAHHCSICKRCVLRMDHHCPFTNCCLGLRNQRFFVSWLFGVWIGCLYGSLVSWAPFSTCILQVRTDRDRQTD